MTINDELLNKLEKLSSLKISPEKREATKAQLSEIVGFVEVLNELDLANLPNSGIQATPFRADTPKSSFVIDEVLSKAPATSEHFFIVPKIIE